MEEDLPGVSFDLQDRGAAGHLVAGDGEIGDEELVMGDAEPFVVTHACPKFLLAKNGCLDSQGLRI